MALISWFIFGIASKSFFLFVFQIARVRKASVSKKMARTKYVCACLRLYELVHTAAHRIQTNRQQNAGVIKVNSVNGNSVDAQKICMAACLNHKGATGCEVIWDQSNRGCYIHTSKVIDHGNRVPHHK